MQANDTVSRFEKIFRLRSDYMSRLQAIDGSTRLQAIVDSLFESPYVRITDVARKLKVHYQTAQADLRRLCAGEDPQRNFRAFDQRRITRRKYSRPPMNSVEYHKKTTRQLLSAGGCEGG